MRWAEVTPTPAVDSPSVPKVVHGGFTRFVLETQLSRLAWSRLLGTYWGWSRLRVLLFFVDIKINTLSCRYLGHSGATVLISNLQLKTKSGGK